MPIDPHTLSSLASNYARGMTSIRGRRVQVGPGITAVVGLSASGAALCATDGRGRQAAVVKWLHGSTQALETHFDLLKDSLPVLGARSFALTELPEEAAAVVRSKAAWAART